MNHNKPLPNQQRRKQHFIDAPIQNRLILGLILLELILFGLAIGFVYWDLQSAIDEQLYRVHQVADSKPVLVDSLLRVVPWVVIINVVALIVVDRWWSRYVNRVLTALHQLLTEVTSLNFNAKPPRSGEHPVIGNAKDWIRDESKRYKDLRALIHMLPDELSAADLNRVNETLQQLQQLFPGISLPQQE